MMEIFTSVQQGHSRLKIHMVLSLVKDSWNGMKLQDRLNLELPYRCQICNFLPACPKPCSQKLLEKGENLPCILNKKYGKENYIIEDFYNFLIESNNEK